MKRSKRSMPPRSSSVGGAPSSITPATAALNRKIGKNPSPRMLTRSEIDLLRQSAREIADAVRVALDRRKASRGSPRSLAASRRRARVHE